MWESAACLLILLTPVLFFATLYPHKDRPLPEWPLGISINALLAIYTLVFKTAISFVIASCLGQRQWAWFSAQPRSLYDMVRYDDAAHSAWGSLLLILWHRLQEPLTVLGSVVAILAVGIDPFVQQIVQTTDCITAIRRHTSAGLPRTNMFTDSIVIPEQQLESTFQNAIHSPGQPALWTCSTGNCTFSEPYTTIGFCSSCIDALQDVTISATCGYTNTSLVDWASTAASDCLDESGSFTVMSTYLIDTPGTLTLNTTLLPPGYISVPVYIAVSTTTPIPELSGLLGGVHSLDFSYLLGKSANSAGNDDWAAVSNLTGCISDVVEAGQGNWTCRGYGAATCQLYPCVREYQANISAALLNEEMVSHSPAASWGSILRLFPEDQGGFEETLFLASLDTHCLTQFQKTTLT